MNTTISITGLAAILAMAYGFDQWSEMLQRQARENFTWTPALLWFDSIANLIIAGSLLALAWFVCFKIKKSPLISIIFVVVGLVVTFSFVLLVSGSLIFPISTGVAEALFPNSQVTFASAFITAIGIGSFFLHKQ